MSTKSDIYDIFVGAETGLLKGVRVEENRWQNVTTVDKICREKEITALCWDNPQQTQVCVGHRDGSVAVYDRTDGEMVVVYDDTGGEGHLKGIAKYSNMYVTCTDKGHLRVMDEQQEKLSLDVGDHIYCMRQHTTQCHLVATGGKENDLKIWNLQKPDEPVFAAKNVRNDWLNLRVPIWVTDAAFYPDSERIVTCTGHHQVRVYDPLSSMRRPVMDVEVEEFPIMSLSLRHSYNQVVVGNTQGVMALVDLRGKGHVVQKYKGFAGGIRDIKCPPERDVIVSCGLDRYLRIHDVNSKQLLHKFYLKSRLNRVLVADKWDSQSDSHTMDTSESITGVKRSATEEEELWDSMGVVKVKAVKRTKLGDSNMEHSGDSDLVDSEHGGERESEEEEEDGSRSESEEEEEEAPRMKKQKKTISPRHIGSTKKQKARHK